MPPRAVAISTFPGSPPHVPWVTPLRSLRPTSDLAAIIDLLGIAFRWIGKYPGARPYAWLGAAPMGETLDVVRSS